jgi:hypothetical protein
MLLVLVAFAVDALVLFGLARLADLIVQVHAARGELAEAAVIAERIRAADNLRLAVGDRLSTATGRAAAALQAIARSPAEAREHIAEAGAAARRAIAEVREVTARSRDAGGLELTPRPAAGPALAPRLARTILVVVLCAFAAQSVSCGGAKFRGCAWDAAGLGGFRWAAGVAVAAGVVEQVLDGLGGGVGDGDPDGHLILVRPVQDLDVQRGVEGPFQIFSFSCSRYHSATPCFTRRTRIIVAFPPSIWGGSSVAARMIPFRDSSFSIFRELNVSRAERSMSSHATTANRGSGLAASASMDDTGKPQPPTMLPVSALPGPSGSPRPRRRHCPDPHDGRGTSAGPGPDFRLSHPTGTREPTLVTALLAAAGPHRDRTRGTLGRVNRPGPCPARTAGTLTSGNTVSVPRRGTALVAHRPWLPAPGNRDRRRPASRVPLPMLARRSVRRPGNSRSASGRPGYRPGAAASSLSR